MDIFTIILIVLGLVIFETINSVDNAIINANILATMHQKYRRWFLFFGILIAVFVVRGLLPWILIWISTPSIGPIGAFSAAFSNDTQISQSIEASSPILLAGAATFLLLLFLHWFFLEPKKLSLSWETYFQNNLFMFYALVFGLMSIAIWISLEHSKAMALGVLIGATVFYCVEAIKSHADRHRSHLARKDISDISKILYLEVIDAAFSIDGVLGAFAFTLSVPLILIGNGIGAFVVRQLTVKNINVINKFRYLKKGAMYSILVVGIIMMLKSFGYSIPGWLPTLATLAIVGFFFYKSEEDIKNHNHMVKKKGY